MFKRAVLLLALIFSVPLLALSQDGWDAIRKNDHKKAQEDFLLALKKDSTDASALKGMIYLSDVTGDQLSYSRYINTLINNHWDEDLYMLFNNEYKGNADKIIAQPSLSARAKLDARLSKADKDNYNRKFEESQKVYNAVFGNYQWTYIGPFKNLNGSGHITPFEVEKEDYNAGKTYVDEDGDELKWVNPPSRDNSEPVAFRDFLMSRNSATYFANLFFDVPDDRTIQLRISRNDPVKLWLDNDLVYENNENTSMEWDNEIVEVKVKAGTHRLLLKSSNYSKEAKTSFDLFNFNYDDLYSSYSRGGGFNRKSSSSSGDFQVRITDTNGELFTDIKTSATGTNPKVNYETITRSFFVLDHYEGKLALDPSDLFDYYALAQACIKYHQGDKYEEYFVKYQRANKDLILAKYLAFLVYFENSKKEKAYEVMNGIDQDQTPIFEILFQKLQEIDKNNDEDKYLAALDNLARISPSNMKVIKRYIEYYEKKGDPDKKEEYIKGIIKKYPEYESNLKSSLKQNLSDKKKERKENFKEEKQQSYSGDIKRTQKYMKKFFYTGDYYDLIEHFKAKDDNAKVLSLYDELIAIQPYNSEHHYEKAKYLFEEEKYDACENELKTALQFKPYKADYYELAGDACYERKDKDKALEYFKQARKYSSRSSIDLKIEKIEGLKQYKKMFTTPTFSEILKQEEWKEKYKDEESVVLLYTKDQVLTPEHETEIYQKFMVKILTDAGTKKWIEYDFGFLGNIKSARIIKKNGAEVIPDGRGGYKVFKNLEAGDIIQLEGSSIYSVAANTITNEYYTRTYLNFEAPVYYEKYEIAVPQSQYFGYMDHKLDGDVQKRTDKGFDFYKWDLHNVPAVAIEEAPIDKMDKWASIMVSTMPDWSKMVTWYERKTYRKLEAGYEIEEILDSIIKPGMTQKEKVETIYNYLTREIKYSYVTFLQSGYVPKDPGQTVCSRIGDCKDVATLMITMLRQVGVESYYVLVKTNDYFHMKTLPSIYFNHCIAAYYLDGKLHFLDMTTDFYPYYILPTMDSDAWALLIKDGVKELVQLPRDHIDTMKNKADITIKAKMNSDRSTDILVTAVHRGSIGGNIREYLTQTNKEEQKNYIMSMLGKGLFENLNLVDYKFDNLLDISSPLTSSYNLNAFNYCDRVASLLVFRIPYMTPVNTHPAILSKNRQTALDVEDIVRVEPTFQRVELTFPDGYDLLEMPKDVNLQGKYGTYRVSFKKIKNGLLVEKYQAFNTSVIDVNEFEDFKKFYQQLLDIDSTKIALKKKA